MDKVKHVRDSKNYNIWLDILRIIAMLGVVAVHLGSHIETQLFNFGGNFVYIFFTLSGYLAMVSYSRNPDAISYYKGRVINILVPYYIVITLVMIWVNFCPKYNVGILDIRWLRYFLGINMLTTSSDYAIWNNLYGWWTMSSFIIFYLFVPLIYRYIIKRWQAYTLTIFSIAVWGVIKTVCDIVDGYNGVYSQIFALLLSGGVYATFTYFAIGIYTYTVLKSNRIVNGIIGIGIILVLGIVTWKISFIIASLTAMFIIIANNINIVLKNTYATAFIRFLSRNSYGIYLSHMFVFDMCDEFFNKYELFCNNKAMWLFCAAILVTTICIFINYIIRIMKWQLLNGKIV